MELNLLIKQLMDSGIVENEELGVTLLKSKEVSDEEKEAYLHKFVERYLAGEFFNVTSVEEDMKKRELFKMWIDLYNKHCKNDVKSRVKKI